MTRRLTDCVATAARRHPNDHAVVNVGESTISVWSWSKLWHESGKAAGLLLRLGVESGETVVYQLPNCAEFVAITLGILRIGAVCCPLAPGFNERDLLAILLRSRARVIFVPSEVRGRHYPNEVAALEPQIQRLAHVIVVKTAESKVVFPQTERLKWAQYHRAIAVAPPDRGVIEERRPAMTAIAELVFTTGRFDALNGVLHRHDALMTAVALHAERLGLDGTDRIFVPSLLGRQTGFLYGMWLALALGVPQILLEQWNPQRALRTVREWRGTFFQAGPKYLADLIQVTHAGVSGQTSLRTVVPVGASVPRDLAARAERALHVRVCGAFGTTESCLATLASPTDPPVVAEGSDGRALSGVDIRVCDDDGRVLSQGQEGQLQIHSPTMFAGYLDAPDLTSEAYTADGWYRSGTSAFIDSDGYLHANGARAHALGNAEATLSAMQMD